VLAEPSILSLDGDSVLVVLVFGFARIASAAVLYPAFSRLLSVERSGPATHYSVIKASNLALSSSFEAVTVNSTEPFASSSSLIAFSSWICTTLE
jgi:hypothetical protein